MKGKEEEEEGRRDASGERSWKVIVCCVVLNLCTLTSGHRTNRKGTQYLVKWRELPYDQATWEYLGEDCGLRGAAAAVEHYEQLRYCSQGYEGCHVMSCDFVWSSSVVHQARLSHP